MKPRGKKKTKKKQGSRQLRDRTWCSTWWPTLQPESFSISAHSCASCQECLTYFFFFFVLFFTSRLVWNAWMFKLAFFWLYLTDINLKTFYSPHHVKRNVACGPKQSLWPHRWNPRPMCQEHICFNPIHLSKCTMILSVLSLGLECLKMNRGVGVGGCLWASLLKCSAVEKCPARHRHLQVHDDCHKASNGTLEPDSYWRSIVLSMWMCHSFCGREEVFRQQLTGNADSSQQTGHRRVSVIVSLRRNMSVCQRHCKNWLSVPVALQLDPLHRFDCILTGQCPAACLFYDWTAVHSSARPSFPCSFLFFSWEHTLCWCGRQLSWSLVESSQKPFSGYRLVHFPSLLLFYLLRYMRILFIYRN